MDSGRQRVSDAVQRHRRRRPLGPPLCSTTFGGSTVPPLFGGGGGDAIGLRDTAVWTVFDSGDGHPDTLIPFPNRRAGDELQVFVISSGLGPQPVEITEWTVQVGTGGISMNVWTRTATNNSDDNFSVPAAFTGPTMLVMASFFQPAGQSFSRDNNGMVFDNFGSDWDINGIATTANPNTIVIAYFMRSLSDNISGLSATDQTGLNLISTNTDVDPVFPMAFWAGWSWRFDAISQVVVGVEQAYLPDPIDATQITRILRWQSL